jgi:hypothetical protein
MLRNTLFVLALISAAVLLGCYKSATTNNHSNSVSNSNSGTSTNSAGSTTISPSSNTASSGEKIGVPECDEFLTAYDACINKHVPEAERATYNAGLKEWRDTWRKFAANPATRPTLSSVCKQTIEQARKSMKAYGCAF